MTRAVHSDSCSDALVVHSDCPGAYLDGSERHGAAAQVGENLDDDLEHERGGEELLQLRQLAQLLGVVRDSADLLETWTSYTRLVFLPTFPEIPWHHSPLSFAQPTTQSGWDVSLD